MLFRSGFTQCDAARDVGVEVSPTLRSGGDGGYPNHSVAYGFEPGIAGREGNPNRFVEEGTPTLRANMGDNQIAAAHAFKVRGGCEGGGKGYLGSDEKAFTLSTFQDQQIAVDVYNQAIDGNVTATLTEACGGTNTSGPKVMSNMAVRRLKIGRAHV